MPIKMLTELFLNISSSIDLRSSLLNIPSSYFFSSYTTPSSPVTAPTFRSERYPPIHPAHAAIISSSTPSSVPFFIPPRIAILFRLQSAVSTCI